MQNRIRNFYSTAVKDRVQQQEQSQMIFDKVKLMVINHPSRENTLDYFSTRVNCQKIASDLDT